MLIVDDKKELHADPADLQVICVQCEDEQECDGAQPIQARYGHRVALNYTLTGQSSMG